MSELRKVEIIIKSESGTNNDASGSNTSETTNSINKDGTTNLGTYLHPVATAEKHILGKSVLLNQAFSYAVKDVQTGISASLHRYTSMKEDYMLNNTINHVETTVGKVTGAGSALLSGAMVGSVGGPAGAIAGATIAVVGYGIGQAFNYQSRMSGYNMALNESNAGINYNRTRAGLEDNGKGTEN